MSVLLLKKLKRMSFAELSFRLKTALAQGREEAAFRLGRDRNPRPGFVSGAASGMRFPYPWFDAKEKTAVAEQLQSHHPQYAEALKTAAEAVRAHRFAFFEAVFQFGENIPWMADPVTGKTRPAVFHAKVDIFGGDTGAGDVKYVWELNRHQFIPTLGQAYAMTGDEGYAEEALNLLDDWIAGNPYLVGINWTSALEVAVRALAWCWGCAFFDASKHFTADRREAIVRALYQHGLYLERHLSFFFSPYNHLIGEAAALYALGSLFPDLTAAARWRDAGWRILEDEMPKQLHPDGGTVEQATGYHHFTLGFYLQAMLIRRRTQDPPPTMQALFERTFDYALHMGRPDGEMPMIGDGDEGKALPLTQSSRWDFRPFLAIGAVLFQRGDFKKMAGSLPPETLWMLGPEAWAAYQALPEAEPSEDSKALPSSGYYTMRTGWDREAHYLNFDCGELSDGLHPDEMPSAAHGHADALAFELSAFGRPLLIDPGFYTYNGPVAWHRYFREAAAHNTVAVDDRSQAEYRGRLTWSRAPKVSLGHWVSTRAFDFVSGAHEGFTRLPEPVVHGRSILFLKPDYWLIRDELTGRGVHQVDRYFHFSPLELVCDERTMAVRTRRDDANIVIWPSERGHGEMDIFEKGEAPDGGWIAPGYGLKVHAPVLRYRVTGPMPMSLHTLIVPYKKTCPEMTVEAVKIESSGDLALGRAFSIRVGEGSDLVIYAPAEGTCTFYGNGTTDAALTCIRRDGAGNVASVLMIDGSMLVVDGETFLKIEKKIHFACLSFEDGRPVVELSEAARVTMPHTKVEPVVSAAGNCIRGG